MPVSKRIADERQKRHDERMTAAAELIPPGLYCYRSTGEFRDWTAPDGRIVKIPKTEPCRFWKRHGSKPHQMNGSCRLMKAADWMTPGKGGTMLLWDQVKECGINDRIEDE